MNFPAKTTVEDLVKAAGPLISDTQGPLDREILSFCTPDHPQEAGFAFLVKPRDLEATLQTNLAALLLPTKFKDKIPETPKSLTLLFSDNPELAAREIKKNLVFPTPFRGSFQGVHPTAVIHETASLDSSVTVGPYAVIGPHCKIESDVFIGAHCVVEDRAQVGAQTTLHPFVYIGHSCVIGKECEIKPYAVIGSEGYGYAHSHKGEHFRIPHTGKVVLEDRVHIGAGTAVDRGTVGDSHIGSGTKIDNQCHLAHNTKIGKNGLITAQMVTAGSSTIGDNFICGGKTAVTGHIEITDNVNVAGLSGIANSVHKPGQYGGYPLQPLREFLKVKASSVHVPELRKQMNRVLRKLFPEDFES